MRDGGGADRPGSVGAGAGAVASGAAAGAVASGAEAGAVAAGAAAGAVAAGAEAGAVAAGAEAGAVVGREARLAPVVQLPPGGGGHLLVVQELVRRATTPGRRTVVLIDGRSGTGKTTLGGAVAEELGAQLVHLDDVYPGWDGLQAASDAVVTDVLGTPSGYRRWDWTRSVPADRVELDPVRPIVVEGCGALSRASAPLATLRVWITADDLERKRRALDRDGDTFGREWERWADQESAFTGAERPEELADVVLQT